jgi:hypothetical protein
VLWHRPPTESAQVGALRPRVDSRVHAYMASHRCSSCPARHAKSCAYRISHFRSGWSTLSCEDAIGCARICLRTAEVRPEVDLLIGVVKAAHPARLQHRRDLLDIWPLRTGERQRHVPPPSGAVPGITCASHPHHPTGSTCNHPDPARRIAGDLVDLRVGTEKDAPDPEEFGCLSQVLP